MKDVTVKKKKIEKRLNGCTIGKFILNLINWISFLRIILKKNKKPLPKRRGFFFIFLNTLLFIDRVCDTFLTLIVIFIFLYDVSMTNCPLLANQLLNSALSQPAII